MKPIQMVDLVTQYEHMQNEIDAAVLGVIRSGRFIGGPEVDGFRDELQAYQGCKHVIPCANGTDALQIVMMALGLEPGDEVITPTFTYIATAEVIGLLRLTPVLVDVDPRTFCLDVEQVRAAITPRTKAIVPVHLYGQCADMEALLQIGREHGIHIIEDNAQAIGSDYHFSDGRTAKSGSMGTYGCTSFFPSKNLGCYGDGGAITTNNDDLAASARMIASHGQSRLYVHDVIGVNSRLDAMQAAILRVKLRQLDAYIARRTALADAYDAAFATVPQITTPFRHPRSKHVFHQYTMQLEGADRDELKKYLEARGVPSMVYYPIPLHGQKAFSSAHRSAKGFPVTDELCRKVISLPIHTEMQPDQLDHIISSVKGFFA
jgi:UDP-2-acetamido-2-deoxy-ribo-hexuluronate aminotransferase